MRTTRSVVPDPRPPKLPLMRILVTGAAGFIGSNFVHYWLDRHPEDDVIALDLLPMRAIERISTTSRTGSRSSRATSPTRPGPSAFRRPGRRVVVFAAESHSSLAVVDPGRFFPRTNVIGTQTLLDAAPGRNGEALPPRLHLRGLRRPRLGATRSSRRTLRTSRARLLKAGADRRAALPRDLRRSRSRTAPTTTGRSSSPRR